MSIVGQAALQVLFEYIVDKLLSGISEYANKSMIDASEVKKCHTLFKDIGAVLQDAELSRFKNPLVAEWLYDLEDLAHDAEDVLQSIYYQVLRRRVKDQNRASSSRVKTTIDKVKDKLPKISSKLKDIMKRLQEMTERMQKLELFAHNLVNIPSSSNAEWSRNPGPFPTEVSMYGRDDKMDTIIELLLNQESQIEVIPIVGMGGSGKTTLAQFIFNVDKIVKHFDKKAWIYVSNTYDMRRILKSIFEAVTSEPCLFDDSNTIKLCIIKELTEKRFFLVLDDLWNNTYEDWADLRALFKFVGMGSKIVVTTRNANVADTVKTVDYEILKPLSDEDCWKILCEHSGIDPNQMSDFRYEKIALQIVKKCSGLPLAAKSVGGVLRHKNSEKQWEAVLGDLISNTNQREDNIMAILKTSYYDLPSCLKRCFASCTLFPKGYKFVEEKVVPIWIGLGLIQKENAEETGCNYFHQLVARSMLLPAGNLLSDFPTAIRDNALELSTGSVSDKPCFIMHDLIRDLAEKIAGELYCVFNEIPDITTKTRHLYFQSYNLGILVETLMSLDISLRSFMPSLSGPDLKLLCSGAFLPHNIIEYSLLDKLLPKLKYLRVFCLPGYGNSELPESIGELRLLRYLDLSGSRIVRLPESTTSLYNLEILMLRYCTQLKELPAGIGNLINLCYLDITKSTKLNVIDYGIEELPVGVQNLTKLRKLSDFIIGRGEGKQIAFLKNLNHLRGELRITGLHNVNSPQDARLAQLSGKNLDELSLIGSKGDEMVDYSVFEELKPYEDLRKLYVHFYKGPSCFPSWVEALKNLTYLVLDTCDKVTTLPVISSFPFLEQLSISSMPAVQEIDLSIGMSSKSSTTNLKHLELLKMKQLKKWSHCDQVQFPRLRRLMIRDCPQLSSGLSVLKSMPSLEELEITRCIDLEVFLPILPRLKKLLIWYCKYLSCSEYLDLQSLESFRLSFLLATPLLFSKSFMQELNYLMHISDWPASAFASPLLIEKIRNGLNNARFLAVDDSFSSAKYARDTKKPTWVLENCLVEVHEDHQLEETGVEILELHHQLLKHLPLWICNAKSLTSLTLKKCPFLRTLSQTGDFPATLTSIELTGCAELMSISETGNLSPGIKRLSVHDCSSLECIVTRDPIGVQGLQILEIGEGCPLVIQKFPEFLHKLNSLADLCVTGCTLEASQAICKSLPNLRRLKLHDCPGIVSFPSVETREVRLRFLTDLSLVGFPNLKQLSSFQASGSLLVIGVARCPVLEKLFDEELSRYVQMLSIGRCPQIEKMVRSGDEQLLRILSHIPYVSVNFQRLSL